MNSSIPHSSHKKRKEKPNILAECKVLTTCSPGVKNMKQEEDHCRVCGGHKDENTFRKLFSFLCQKNVILFSSGSAKVKTFVSLQMKGISKGMSAVCISLS